MLAPEFKRDRQLGKEAIRRFSENIDLRDDSECTSELFGCSRCEVGLASNDCEQLGLDAEHEGNRKYKRFSALNIHGKVIGYLRD